MGIAHYLASAKLSETAVNHPSLLRITFSIPAAATRVNRRGPAAPDRLDASVTGGSMAGSDPEIIERD